MSLGSNLRDEIYYFRSLSLRALDKDPVRLTVVGIILGYLALLCTTISWVVIPTLLSFRCTTDPLRVLGIQSVVVLVTIPLLVPLVLNKILLLSYDGLIRRKFLDYSLYSLGLFGFLTLFIYFVLVLNYGAPSLSFDSSGTVVLIIFLGMLSVYGQIILQDTLFGETIPQAHFLASVLGLVGAGTIAIVLVLTGWVTPVSIALLISLTNLLSCLIMIPIYGLFRAELANLLPALTSGERTVVQRIEEFYRANHQTGEEVRDQTVMLVFIVFILNLIIFSSLGARMFLVYTPRVLTQVSTSMLLVLQARNIFGLFYPEQFLAAFTALYLLFHFLWVTGDRIRYDLIMARVQRFCTMFLRLLIVISVIVAFGCWMFPVIERLAEFLLFGMISGQTSIHPWNPLIIGTVLCLIGMGPIMILLQTMVFGTIFDRKRATLRPISQFNRRMYKIILLASIFFTLTWIILERALQINPTSVPLIQRIVLFGVLISLLMIYVKCFMLASFLRTQLGTFRPNINLARGGWILQDQFGTAVNVILGLCLLVFLCAQIPMRELFTSSHLLLLGGMILIIAAVIFRLIAGSRTCPMCQMLGPRTPSDRSNDPDEVGVSSYA